MALSIANNVSSLNAQHNLTRASSSVAKSVERLSSGLKVNRGADGPAALVISEKQRAQIAGLRQAIDNSEKAVSLVQTAEGALNEINSLLTKVRSLAIDSANSGVNDADALAANQAEIANALETVTRISTNTQFGSKKLLNGDAAGLSTTPSSANVTDVSGTTDTQAGTYAVEVTTEAERATVDATAQTTTLAADEVLTINGVTINLTTGDDQDAVVAKINAESANTGVIADKNGAGGATRLYSSEFGSAATISAESDVAAAGDTSGIGTTALTDDGVDIEGTIDGDAATGLGTTLTANTGDANGLTLSIAEDGTDLLKSVTGAQGNVVVEDSSLVFQIGANQNQTAKISIANTSAASLGTGVADNQFASLAEIDVSTASGAQDAIGIIDSAINTVSTLRGTLGAFQQNTLESTANNLRSTLENTVNAESVIRDTDFAEEIANFTKNQVLVQAGTSVLGNANQLPQLVLSLLG
ncbi:MAG: flagellin [Fuerstiella sp.]